MPYDEPMLASGWVGAWVALVGACLGSFLNVVIARVPAGESIVTPGSRCPRCRTPIAWHDNIPVLSWLRLRGRCRACRAPISLRYPAVELAVAAIAVLAWWRHGLGGPAAGELALGAVLLALALIDYDSWLLPHALTFPLAAAGLLAAAAGWAPAGTLAASAAGSGVGLGLFGLIWLLGEKLLRRDLLGLGDAFLLAGIGAWLGLRALLPVVLLASIQGSVFGGLQLLLGRGQPGPAGPRSPAGAQPSVEPAAAEVEPQAAAPEPERSEEEWTPPRHAVPFGPFLAAGAVEWLYLAAWLSGLVPILGAFR